MNTQLVINGLPDKLRLDGWWLGCEATPKPLHPGAQTPSSAGTNAPRKLILFLLLCLVALADWLFWHQKAGASVAIFSFLLSLAMVLARTQKTTRKEWAFVAGLALGVNLPLLEQLQPLSLMFSMLGVALIASWLAMEALVGWGRAIGIFLKITALGPLRFSGVLGAALHGARPQAAL
ncbi:MAG TPA: hypothetical protein EYG79_06640, partial [Rhodobacteraceae bacterium]|nr:hypothetical protein [Paracoccaceae bacterium]